MLAEGRKACAEAAEMVVDQGEVAAARREMVDEFQLILAHRLEMVARPMTVTGGEGLMLPRPGRMFADPRRMVVCRAAMQNGRAPAKPILTTA